IVGTGAGALVSASGLGDRVFHVKQPPSGPISVTFAGIWIANGTATASDLNGNVGGAGLLIEDQGSVTLTSSRVLSNTVLAPPSKVAEGGGILHYGGTLTLNNVLLSANKVLSGGAPAAGG